MSHYSAAASLLLVATLAGGCVKHVQLRNVTESCPLPADARGYPVSATSTAGAIDSIFLRRIARAVARRFSGKLAAGEDTLPSPSLDARMESVERGEVLWRDWQPTVNDTGRMVLAYRRVATRPELRLTHVGPPTAFEALIQQAVRRAMVRADSGRPSRDPFPMALPTGSPDSALVTVAFGSEPAPGAGSVRFALQQRRVRVKAPAHPPTYPVDALFSGSDGKVMLAYIVLPNGTADMSTALVVSSTGDEFAEAVMAALPSYRYVPAQLDCRDVPQFVEQPFTFSISPARGEAAQPTFPPRP